MAHFYTNNTLAIQYCVIVIFDKLDHFNVILLTVFNKIWPPRSLKYVS